MALKFLNDGYFAGKVGIGTESPDGNLEVITSTIVSGASDTVNNVLIGLQAANRPTIILDTADTTYTNRSWNITNVGSAGKLFIGRNGLDVMVMDNDGKVGIGTSSPTQKLDVIGRVRASYDTSNYYEIGASSAGGFVVGKNGGVETVNIRTYGDSHFYGGNVGIGTSSPTHLLTLEKASSPGLKIKDTTQGTTLLAFSQDSNSHIGTYSSHPLVLDTNSAERMRITSGGNVGIGTITPDSKLDVTGGDITVNTSGVGFMNFKYGSVGSESTMGSIQTTGIDLKINATSDLLLLPGSNVGIGTTSPGKKLDVVSTSGTSIVQSLRNPSTSWNQYALTRYGTEGADFRYMDFGYFRGNNNEATRGLVVKSQANATLVTFLDAGNVGIGTSSPTQLLHVNSTTSNPTGIGLQNSQRYYSVRSNNYSLVFTDETVGTERMRIDSSGNVGIGTTSPSAKLDVQGTILVNNEIQFVDANMRIFRSGTNMRFRTGGSDKVTIESGGNVGIGTTNPLSRLHVLSREIGNGANKGIRIENYNGSKDYSIRTGVSGYENTSLAFYDETAGANRIVIETGGEVGIGSIQPTQKLHVAGNLRVTGAYYDSNNSPGTANQVLVSTASGTDWVDGSAIPGVPAGSGAAGQVTVWSGTDVITGYTRFKV
ncbi:MAG: hypothetical protein GY787_19180, partial [Alteromonadales bacterium]|nr:hypothetical protein [Alteromonadales bacterium]